MADDWSWRRQLSGVARSAVSLLWLTSIVSGIFWESLGESTYAGDRDVRFLTCAVPCEFECQHPEAPSVAFLQRSPVKQVVKEMQTKTKSGQPVDLRPHGKRHYTSQLQAALNEALANLPAQTRNVNSTKLTVRAVPTKDLALVLRFSGWSCEENCRYDCMVQNRRVRHEKGEQQVHYYGKWAFTRVLGVQELFSSLFSAFNGLPYVLFLVSCRSGMPKGTRTAKVWILYALTMSNTWLQSTLFHARENWLTEILDYDGATLGLSMSFGTALMMNLPERWPVWRSTIMTVAPIFFFWLSHVFYLSFVNFDYGYNMKVAVGLGICATLSWIVWFFQRGRERRFAWKCMVASLGPYLVLPLELLDFPPAFGLLDAHALWHLGTVPCSFAWGSFMQDVIRWEAEAATSKSKAE